jgi:hypothetical protein
LNPTVGAVLKDDLASCLCRQISLQSTVVLPEAGSPASVTEATPRRLRRHLATMNDTTQPIARRRVTLIF